MDNERAPRDHQIQRRMEMSDRDSTVVAIKYGVMNEWRDNLFGRWALESE